MPDRLSLTYTSGLILQTIAQGLSYGFNIIDHTGLPSGTVYPALRRLESGGLVESLWDHRGAEKSGGPPRKYYRLTASGRARLKIMRDRYPLLQTMAK
ncbi:MAG: PadR family transcriptional regulator [Bryobacteraceae bacterium]